MLLLRESDFAPLFMMKAQIIWGNCRLGVSVVTSWTNANISQHECHKILSWISRELWVQHILWRVEWLREALDVWWRVVLDLQRITSWCWGWKWRRAPRESGCTAGWHSTTNWFAWQHYMYIRGVWCHGTRYKRNRGLHRFVACPFPWWLLSFMPSSADIPCTAGFVRFGYRFFVPKLSMKCSRSSIIHMCYSNHVATHFECLIADILTITVVQPTFALCHKIRARACLAGYHLRFWGMTRCWLC